VIRKTEEITEFYPSNVPAAQSGGKLDEYQTVYYSVCRRYVYGNTEYTHGRLYKNGF